jgi:nicotinamidase-related amidase
VIARLVREQAVLLVIDVQERLMAAMDEQVAPRVVRNICILIEAARRMGIPIVASEQYPKGLGPTVAPIAAALAEAGDAVHRFDKLEFSAAAAAPFTAIRDKLRPEPAKRADLLQLASHALERLVHGDRHQWIVCGAETHVCVYQTVRDLTNLPAAAVHVVADAVCSRTKQNWRIGLELARQHGAVVSSTEVCVFDLLGCAGTDEFKAMSKAVK